MTPAGFFFCLVCKYSFVYIGLLYSVQGSVYHVFTLFLHLMNKTRWAVSKYWTPLSFSCQL